METVIQMNGLKKQKNVVFTIWFPHRMHFHILLMKRMNKLSYQSSYLYKCRDLHSRYEIKLENYVKTLHIEANTMIEIIQKDLLPSITTYMEKVAQTAALKRSVVPNISVSGETSLLTRLTELAETMTA